jgi:enoyl-CoA hydratase/carnithine racemase
VQGTVRTVGHELMLAGDIRIAAKDAVFAQSELSSGGIMPFGGSTIRFPREAGWANAMRYILTADEWSAEEAYRLGLVQAVTEPGSQLDRALEFARKIAAAPPLAVRATLVSARQALASEDAAIAAIAPAAAKIRASSDYQEFQRALQEKRPPAYHGL